MVRGRLAKDREVVGRSWSSRVAGDRVDWKPTSLFKSGLRAGLFCSECLTRPSDIENMSELQSTSKTSLLPAGGGTHGHAAFRHDLKSNEKTSPSGFSQAQVPLGSFLDHL